MATKYDHNLFDLLSARSYLPVDGQSSANRDSASTSINEVTTSPEQSSLSPMDSARVTRQRRSSRNVGRPRVDAQSTAVLSEVCMKQR